MEKDLEFERTNAISFSISNGNKLHYFEHWHTLRFVLSDYDLVRAVGGFEQDFEKNIFSDFEGDEWQARTKEGFAAYNKLRLAQIKPAPKRTAYGITGLGQIERDRIVGAYVRDPARPPSDRDDASYEKTFRDVIVSITGVTDEDDNAGSLFLFAEDSGDIRPGEDNLHLTLYLPSDRLRDLIAEIRSSKTRPQLHVAAIVALYQSEVEASLRDWHHPQTFLLPQPHGQAPARLMQVRFGFDKERTLETLDLPEPVQAREELVADTKPQPAQATSTASLKSIKIALWIIAVASVLRLLIR
ncbi:hypothetical protein [Rhizobium ruizarguesonis]|uniref:hypothetical protein n=1 Tax=Rhizobium ruizarguesonis TaxID=2081791 RepID=UPI00102FC93F|nr:hypothetical protein [Rhizobium ruizarguesonis]TAV14708.1 hypothetical protein ELI34_04160 [Rhizobium ruizarguesonis]